MTLTPELPAPVPSVPAGPSPTDVDQTLTERCTTSGEVIAGHIARGMLDVVSRPAKLPTLLFPDDDPETVDRVWALAVAVGYRAGKHASRDWEAEGFAKLKAALYEVGYRGMARLAVRTANTTAPVAQETEHERVTDGFDGTDWDTSTWGGGHP